MAAKQAFTLLQHMGGRESSASFGEGAFLPSGSLELHTLMDSQCDLPHSRARALRAKRWSTDSSISPPPPADSIATGSSSPPAAAWDKIYVHTICARARAYVSTSDTKRWQNGHACQQK